MSISDRLRVRELRPGIEDELRLRITREALAAFPEMRHATLADLEADRTAPRYVPHGELLAEWDGRPVGFVYAEADLQDPERVGYLSGPHVLIEYRRRGIGAALVREGIGHLRRHGMRIAKTDVRANNAGARAFLATFGFRECRAVSWMRRTLDDLPGAEEDGPAGAAAGGHEIREETANEANYAQLTRLFNETMAGHYGTKLSAVADTRHMYEVSRATGVEVYTLVARPDAGFVLALVDRTENEASGRQQGMLYSIGVRKESRRQGLGRALVLAGLRRLRATGVGEAVLFVDEAGADRAIDLYRRLGFAVTSRSLFFELDLS